MPSRRGLTDELRVLVEEDVAVKKRSNDKNKNEDGKNMEKESWGKQKIE